MNQTSNQTNQAMKKILLVEDDPQIVSSMQISLRYGGFSVNAVATVEQGWSSFAAGGHDILILDVNLPDGTGLQLCERIRKSGSEIPILFLSARTDEETVVEGLKVGGDDYIRKPFGVEELKMRIGKALERGYEKRDVLHFGEMTIDVPQRVATVSGQTLTLGKREFDILVFLARRPGDVISRESILAQLEENVDVYDRTIDSHMSHLRKKLSKVSDGKLKILPVYGVGYRLKWI